MPRFDADYVPPSAMTIFAHPDDAEFLVSGTIARWTRAGCEVTSVVITSGNVGTHDATYTREMLARKREAEQHAGGRARRGFPVRRDGAPVARGRAGAQGARRLRLRDPYPEHLDRHRRHDRGEDRIAPGLRVPVEQLGPVGEDPGAGRPGGGEGRLSAGGWRPTRCRRPFPAPLRRGGPRGEAYGVGPYL